MSTVLFYTKDLEESVNNFMSSIQNDSSKAMKFVTFDQMSQRTKVTLESSATEVVSSIITFGTLISDVFIFVPWMSLIRGSLKEYIDTHEVDNIVYMMLSTEESKSSITLLSGESQNNIMVIPESGITYEMFVPNVKRVMYLIPSAKVEEDLKNVTPKSQVEFNNIALLRDTCKFEDTVNIGIAMPQLQIGTWNEMFKLIESSIETNPVDAIYCESKSEEETSDFFMRSIIKLVGYTIPVYYGERVFDIIEVDSEKSVSSDDENIPSVEAEVVSSE